MQAQALSPDPAPSHSSTGSSDFPAFSGMFSVSPFVASTDKSSSLWLLDTGATHHVCCSSTLFNTLTPLNNAYITLPNSNKVIIQSIGTVILTPTITLTSMFFVPDFSYNLISVSALTTSNSCQVSFTHNSCIIEDISKAMQIGIGKRFGNLYILDLAFPCTTFSSCNSIVSSTLWHSRLGHPSFDKLKLLSSTLSIKKVESELCEVCPLSKQKHNPYYPSSSSTNACFDLIHCDVWGPFTLVSVDGHKYFITIVDDYSRFVWTYLLTSKGEVRSILSQFFTQINTQFHKTIKTVRCDNGTEFQLPYLFAKHGTFV